MKYFVVALVVAFAAASSAAAVPEGVQPQKLMPVEPAVAPQAEAENVARDKRGFLLSTYTAPVAYSSYAAPYSYSLGYNLPYAYSYRSYPYAYSSPYIYG
ncbi:uncharacterized protein LOC105698604 [Orussus abietinus]|uniref:uncharacterized protein LOC105698604 n=1 Tax=Orussus abietinus TaxID=222816 RepID=UPI000C7160A3|nr:uncharacterized protein LOC105698604 [Orussus abietinus]